MLFEADPDPGYLKSFLKVAKGSISSHLYGTVPKMGHVADFSHVQGSSVSPGDLPISSPLNLSYNCAYQRARNFIYFTRYVSGMNTALVNHENHLDRQG